MNIIFFGTPDFAMPVLDALIGVGYDVFHFQPKSLKDDAVFNEFKKLNPDLCVVAAYGKIIPQKFLDIPKHGFINIHPSFLPKYRGPSPIQTAILNGDKETGVSVMVVDAEIDHGPILNSIKYSVSSIKYFPEIAKELFELGANLLIETLPKYLNGEIKAVEQDHDQATFTKMFTREDGRINWSQPSEKIYNQTKALNPEPGTWTTWKGKVINISTITTRGVVSPQEMDLALNRPGMVGKIDNDIAIKTGTDYLVLKSIQLEGRKVTDAKSFVNGHPDFLNSTLN